MGVSLSRLQNACLSRSDNSPVVADAHGGAGIPAVARRTGRVLGPMVNRSRQDASLVTEQGKNFKSPSGDADFESRAARNKAEKSLV